ncbi:helix-turn-helix domain-containing protein [Paenibacillus pseudetheri]|uniref:HTH cro/C1-type domain-containing protein n=1 Tax=Paenibacillus pseudetheri TaxID=2897682 RepID=A0ABN8FQQ7_9BACL|nr:helix-turn-helix transcriptional regulator [Paenibacillus pseudetheri]CAH1058829.1 hypothetical protein PAECIP111894_05015 [Paenibacillus pseudetheri]
MLRLKIKELRELEKLSVRQLSETTNIRWNTLSDMEKNTAKHWPPEHLETLMKYFKLKHIDQLIEYVEEPGE